MRHVKETNTYHISHGTALGLQKKGLCRVHYQDFSNLNVPSFKAKGMRMLFPCKGVKLQDILDFIISDEKSS